MKKLIFWEMNEINFDFLNFYIKQGHLPNWKAFLEKYAVIETVSENVYENLEPWIQWPTVRTGYEYCEHKVFRLGDMESSGVKQHWEIIEEAGYSVGAISPINGSNQTKKSKFWIPDPWVKTKISGGKFEHEISEAVNQAVNDNSQEKITLKTSWIIFKALTTKARLKSFTTYAKSLLGALKGQHWSKAAVFDRLLADIYIFEWKKNKPDFSTLFLNCGAHTQHHYMCSSPAYIGSAKNPGWYVPEGKDPLLDILKVYDGILADLQSLPNTRLMVAVGMRQIPHEEPIFYWRLKDHNKFLAKIGIKFLDVQPRMTRDFLVLFDSEEDARLAQSNLSSFKSLDGDSIFGVVDNRGSSLFVTLTYSSNIENGFSINNGKVNVEGFDNDVVFVAIKNGKHDALGYFVDSECPVNNAGKKVVPLKQLFSNVLEHFNIA